jgi:RNA polymerase sigma-70 factor (ECF subfamily)
VRREISLEEVSQALERSASRLSRLIERPDEMPAEGLERRERARYLGELMAGLPAHYREVLVLRNLQGLAFGQVAARMDRSVPAAKMLWLRAVKLLRLRYESHSSRSADLDA